jgi:aryl-alcohol dehydrogenase-like predicted oxidoreductase
MRYNHIGRAGIQVSAVGLGNWNTFGVKVNEAEALRILFAAREAGINFLDTADTYGNGAGEAILGRFLQQIDRNEMVVATKMFFPLSADPNDRGLSRKHIHVSVERSLKRLRTDYIDLLQCHRFDSLTPLDETISAMDNLVRQGKILYWGVSRFSDEQITSCCELASEMSAERPISNQFVYNLLERSIETSALATCGSLGVGVIGYSPLAQGVLTGKYLDGRCPTGSRGDHATAKRDMWQHKQENEATVAGLNAVASRNGITLSTLALASCLSRPGISSVLTGATSPEQIHANAQAAELDLDRELIDEVEVALSLEPQGHKSISSNSLVVDTKNYGVLSHAASGILD